jgi:hypothetical protein
MKEEAGGDGGPRRLAEGKASQLTGLVPSDLTETRRRKPT